MLLCLRILHNSSADTKDDWRKWIEQQSKIAKTWKEPAFPSGKIVVGGNGQAVNLPKICLIKVTKYCKDFCFDRFAKVCKYKKIITCNHIIGQEDMRNSLRKTYVAHPDRKI